MMKSNGGGKNSGKPMPPKARVGVRLKEAVTNKQSLNKSADLTALTEKYNLLQAKQKSLIVALKTHHASIVRMSKSRVQVADQLAAITKGSELYECAGQLPTEGMARNEVCSYASIHHNMATRTKTYADKYGQFVINYAIEWDKVVTTRVSNGLKEAEQFRRDLDHYQKKVESLRQSVNQTLSRGKQVDSKTQEKLSRNEEKLTNAKLQYNKIAINMCLLIEEVTERAWKDIHPMMVKIVQFDQTLSSDETKALGELKTIEDKLKRLADTHQLKPQARLKDIETLKPELLNTRPMDANRIEADPTASGAFSDMTSPMGMALPPGTVSPQGMGGYPVPVATATSRASSVSSFSSYGQQPTMSTTEMLNIANAAAPPPTLDQVNSATGALTISGGSPSYSLGTPTNGYQRSASMPPDYAMPSMSADSSVGSYISAPPPASAPPPPPPDAPLSMYGGIPMPHGEPVPAPTPPSYNPAYNQPQPTYGQPPPSPYGAYGAPAPAYGSNQFGAPPPLGAPSPTGSNPNPFGQNY